MTTSEIAALLRPFATLEPDQLEQISIYIDLILKWNLRINLTAVREPEDIVQRHFGESLFVAAQLLQPQPASSVIDVGSGAGFPGIPLAMFAPASAVTLIESNSKKAAFLNEVIRALRLRNVSVFKQRAESYSGSALLVVMRAVKKFSQALPLALKLVQPAGRLALMIGISQVEDSRRIAGNLLWQAPVAIPGGHSRVLFTGTKAVIVE